MMKNDKYEEDNLIDAYYNEIDNSNLNHIDSEIFQHKLEKSLNKMNLLNNIDFDSDINIMDLIVKGEEVKERKRNFKELLNFLFISTLFLCIVVFFSFTLSPNIFIYIEILTSVLLPLIVIPVAIRIHIKENIR